MKRRKFLVGLGALGALVANVAIVEVFRRKRRPLPGSQGLSQNGISSAEVDTDVCAIAFSSHGLALASASADGGLRLWDPRTGKATSSAPASTHGQVSDMGFLSSDTWLATAARGVPYVQMWNPAELSKPAIVDVLGGATAFALSPDYKRGVTPPPMMAAVGLSNSLVSVFAYGLYVGRFHEFAPVTLLRGHSGTVQAITFSRDGLQLATGSEDATVRLWDCRRWGAARILPGVGRPVQCVAFSQDGNRLCAGYDDGRISVWDLRTHSETVLQDGNPSIARAVFCGDDWLASVGSHQTISMWSLGTGRRAEFPGNPGKYATIDISGDGEFLAVPWKDGVRVFRTTELISQAEARLKA